MTNREDMKQTHVYLTVEQWERVASIARKEHRSVTQQITHWVHQALERKNGK
jgi:transposase-like protein